MPQHPFFLRPTFTRRFSKKITEGRSLLVIGADGQGRYRLFEDVAADPQGGVRVVLLKMPKAQEVFFQEVAHRAGLEVVPDSAQTLVDQLKGLSGKVWLIMDEVHHLQDAPSDFWRVLGQLTLDPRLVMVAGLPDDRDLPTELAQLPLDHVRLPPLNPRRLEEELSRKAAGLKNSQDLAFVLFTQADSYKALNKLIDYWEEKGRPAFIDPDLLADLLKGFPG